VSFAETIAHEQARSAAKQVYFMLDDTQDEVVSFDVKRKFELLPEAVCLNES
jgi:hypothetical protein